MLEERIRGKVVLVLRIKSKDFWGFKFFFWVVIFRDGDVFVGWE